MSDADEANRIREKMLDVFRMKRDLATARGLLTRIAEYEPDWTKGVAENVNALQAIAESGLGSPGTSAPPRCASWCNQPYATAMPAIVSSKAAWWAKVSSNVGGFRCMCSEKCLAAGKPLRPADTDPRFYSSGPAADGPPQPLPCYPMVQRMDEAAPPTPDLEHLGPFARAAWSPPATPPVTPINLTQTYPSEGISGTTADAHPLHPPEQPTCPTCGCAVIPEHGCVNCGPKPEPCGTCGHADHGHLGFCQAPDPQGGPCMCSGHGSTTREP